MFCSGCEQQGGGESSLAPSLGPRIFKDCCIFRKLVKWVGDSQGREFSLQASSFSAREAEVSAVTLSPKYARQYLQENSGSSPCWGEPQGAVGGWRGFREGLAGGPSL